MAGTVKLNINALRVLALLYHATDAPYYGLTISRSLQMGNGTLYPILDKLEDGGLVAGSWEDIDPRQEGRRPRRYYELTGAGVRAFEAARQALFDPAWGGNHEVK